MDNYQLVVGNEGCPLNIVVPIIRQSSAIQNEWSTFARRLDVSSGQIKSLWQDFFLKIITYEDILVDVLEIWIGKNGSKATLANLLQVVENHCGAYDVGELLRLEYYLPCKEADGDNTVEWDGLSPAFQKRVKETFQHFSPNLKFTDVLPKLSGAALISLMRGKKPNILSLPEELEYYVNRTIITSNVISEEIFNQASSDIFLFMGMNRYELSVLAKNKLTGRSREHLIQYGVNVKFMILDQESHFERICGKTNHPVHLLRKEKTGKLRWMKSKGEMDTLREYIDHEQDTWDEGQFCQICTSKSIPVLICDSPGMGKSVFLAQIGRRLASFPDRTVLFIVFSEFIQLAKSFGMEDKIKTIEITLQSWAGEAIPRSNINSEEEPVSIELLLDGYDEVDSADRKLALEILQSISNSFKYLRLWITSRLHLMEELENNLNILGHKIRPFHEEDQVHFLSSFWSRTEQLDQDKIELFAKKCLKSLKATINSNNNDIAGIPLQCLLIGEVYEDEAVEYAKICSESESNAALEIEAGTIANLYSRLVKIKFHKYKSAYGNPKLSEDDLMSIHSHLSLELLFPVEHGLLKLTKAGEIQLDEVVKAGILTSSRMGRGGVTFLHRTFAEYFVAWFVVDKVKQKEKWRPELLHLLFRIITGCSSFGVNKMEYGLPWTVCCYFLNSMIANLQVERLNFLFESPLKYWQLELIERTARHCLEGNFIPIFKLFDTHGIFDKVSFKSFNVDLLLVSLTSSVELVIPVLAHFERYRNFDFMIQKAMLREAVKHGKFSIVEYLIKEKQLGSLVEYFDGQTNLVCDCVEGTMGSSDEVIKEKILVLQMLVGINGSLVNDRNGFSNTAPFSPDKSM